MKAFFFYEFTFVIYLTYQPVHHKMASHMLFCTVSFYQGLEQVNLEYIFSNIIASGSLKE